MKDIRQGEGWGKYLKTRGWKIDFVPCADKKHKLQVLILKLGWWPFTVLKLQRAECDPDFVELGKIRRKYWAINSYLEPQRIQNIDHYTAAGFRRSKLPFLATKTVVIDLKKPIQTLWRNLSENTRRLIKKNNKIRIVEMEPVDFHRYWKLSSKVWVLSLTELLNLKKSFGEDAKLWGALDERGFHSGLVSLNTKDTFNYFQTWTSPEGRRSGAHFSLVWETILSAKKNGKKFYDFEGIFDPEFPIKKWKGFTEFKLKFGGKVVTHPGTFGRLF